MTIVAIGHAGVLQQAIAKELGGVGASVLVANRNLAGAEAVAKAIEAAGGRAVAHEVNVADAAAVEAMVAAAVEYAKQGIRINAVGPAFIDTPLLSAIDPAALQYITGLHPVGRLGTSEEVSALTCFLLSDEAPFITGSYHLVDGGYAAP